MRSRDIEKRPSSFVSTKGKRIEVNQKVAVKNDRTLQGGKVVHKQLEKEIYPEEVKVQTTTSEEKWALRLLNMLIGLQSLVSIGCCRELPVFGIYMEQLVIGVVDEVQRFPLESVKDNQTELQDKSQPKITTFLNSVSPQRDGDAKPLPKFGLRVLDTKTRRYSNLPSETDTLPSRLQVMMYKTLLDSLLSISNPYDFNVIWDRLHLDSTALFSQAFMESAALSWESNGGLVDGKQFSCLNDFTDIWRGAIHQLEAGDNSVDGTLQIIYRKRGSRKRTSSELDTGEALVRNEDLDLQRAIEASLREAGGLESTLSPFAASDIADPFGPAIETPPKSLADDTPISIDLDSKKSDRPASPALSSKSHSPPRRPGSPEIIGIKEFQHEPQMLASHIRNVLDWWMGLRGPEGVSIENTGRCNHCEYKEECEWREMKALAF
ncbi:hypothetical protein SISSUDRAFT_1038982 [Sistotremastrum suecicum HHB10207 ss-3]|uniref:Exonuclease V n=1 Tax=Sistotremastrum suecicum HHB10207 ss-3 TaxID=1314776 RepID=A0A166J811_9AGAM|nr:hypothetical protein SISSUDRAFT_1038982 [Sistotremastrum suecicum HHB10207 ss-3]